MTSLKNRYREYQEEDPKVVLMVNDKAACNLNCSCCYLPYEGVREPDEVLRIVEKLNSKFKVSIAGSEILTNPGYLEAYKLAGQKYILTNGVLLDKQPELFDRLSECGIEEIQISLNFRGQKDAEGVSEEMVTRVVREAKRRGFWVRIACIVTQENYQDVGEMCNKTNAMGADAIFFLRYIKSGSAKTEERETLTPEQRDIFFQLVDGTRKGYAKDELEIRVNGNFGPKKGSKGEKLSANNKYCHAGRTLFIVDPDDNVYGCPYLMEYPIGKLIDESRLEINNDLCDGNRTTCLTDFMIL